MQMSEEEYERLISRFEFLNDKVESCYKEETNAFVEKMKTEYAKNVTRF